MQARRMQLHILHKERETAEMPSKTLTALYGTDYNDGADTMLLLLYIVDRCNYSCSYCFNKKPRTGGELDADDIFRFIDYVHE